MTVLERLKKLCRTSIFVSMMMWLVNAVYNGLRDGFFGRIMTSYPVQEQLFREGLIGSFFSKRGALASRLRRFRLRLAEFFEKSALLDIGLKKASYLLGCSLRVYGIFLLTFGGYTVLVHYIKLLAFPSAMFGNGTLIWGIISIVLAIPMIGSRHSVAELLQNGLLMHLLLIDTFGITEDRFDVSRVKKGGRYNVALLLGMFVGILTFILPPQYIILFLLSILGIAVVMSYPEIGVLSLIALTPVLSFSKGTFRALEFGIALTSIAYLGKLIRGKRVFRLSLIDVMVLVFGGVLCFSGMISVSVNNSTHQVWHFCLFLLMYFMIVNLIRTPAWLHRAVLAGVGSAVLLSFVGIFQYLNGNDDITSGLFRVSTDWFRNSTAFESSSAFSAFLILLLPLTVAIFVTASDGKSRLVAFGGILAIGAVLILVRSTIAWIAALSAMLLFFLIYSRKTVCWLALFGLSVPIWDVFLPDYRFSQLFAIADLSDPMQYERFRGWQGTLQMLRYHLFGGIGYGTEAFGEVYPRYSLSGLAQVKSPDQLYLSLLCAFGIFGVLVFLAMVVLFSQHCFSYIGNASERYSGIFVAAGFSSIIGALIMGFGCDIWCDISVFLTFFTVFALTCAYVRTGNMIRTRNQDVGGIGVSHAHVDLHFEA